MGNESWKQFIESREKTVIKFGPLNLAKALVLTDEQ